VSDWYARLCLSCKIQVVYSVCRMRLSATGFTLPWQLVAAHEPGPIYFCGSLVDFADCAATANASARIALLAASALRKQSLAKEFIKNRVKNLLAYIVRWQAKSTSEHCLYRMAR
jgi:hypothetical protein